MSEPTAPPATFMAGTTVEFRRSLPDFPANDGWTLKFVLRGPSVLDGTVTPDGADHLVAFAADDTAELDPGIYTWAELATKGGKTLPGDSGRLTVERNLLTALAGEAQSDNERILAALNCRIKGRITADAEAYAIDGVQVSRIAIEKLEQLKGVYESRVASERRGGAPRQPIRTAFTPL